MSAKAWPKIKAVMKNGKPIERARVIDAPPGIFTPEQAAALLTEQRSSRLSRNRTLRRTPCFRARRLTGATWILPLFQQMNSLHE